MMRNRNKIFTHQFRNYIKHLEKWNRCNSFMKIINFRQKIFKEFFVGLAFHSNKTNRSFSVIKLSWFPGPLQKHPHPFPCIINTNYELKTIIPSAPRLSHLCLTRLLETETHFPLRLPRELQPSVVQDTGTIDSDLTGEITFYSSYSFHDAGVFSDL